MCKSPKAPGSATFMIICGIDEARVMLAAPATSAPKPSTPSIQPATPAPTDSTGLSDAGSNAVSNAVSNAEFAQQVADYVVSEPLEAEDGTTATDASCDYPDYAAAVARAVGGEAGTVGLLICGSGVGVSIAANKIPGIRAVDAWSVEVAEISRGHNDTNVLCLGARFVPEAEALAEPPMAVAYW